MNMCSLYSKNWEFQEGDMRALKQAQVLYKCEYCLTTQFLHPKANPTLSRTALALISSILTCMSLLDYHLPIVSK